MYVPLWLVCGVLGLILGEVSLLVWILYQLNLDYSNQKGD